jgi:hypothetical protein
MSASMMIGFWILVNAALAVLLLTFRTGRSEDESTDAMAEGPRQA